MDNGQWTGEEYVPVCQLEEATIYTLNDLLDVLTEKMLLDDCYCPVCYSVETEMIINVEKVYLKPFGYDNQDIDIWVCCNCYKTFGII